MMRANGIAVLCLACSGLALSQACAAGDTDGWQFEVTPYLLGAAMDGTVGARGFETDVDVSFSDILDHLDAGFMGVFAAQKGRWSFALEGVYMKLEADSSKSVSGPGGVVSVDGELEVMSSLSIVQGTVGYRVVDAGTRLDLLGALRYTRLEAELDVTTQFTPGVVFPGGSRSGDDTESWTDAVVGLRVSHPVSDKVSLLGYVDAGAGGSDLTYQVIAGVNWEFAKDYIAKLGYRRLYWDYDDGGIVWDMTASGPYLGLGIRF
jgi:hypothetical protein